MLNKTGDSMISPRERGRSYKSKNSRHECESIFDNAPAPLSNDILVSEFICGSWNDMDDGSLWRRAGRQQYPNASVLKVVNPSRLKTLGKGDDGMRIAP